MPVASMATCVQPRDSTQSPRAKSSSERAHLAVLWLAHAANGSDDGVLMDVEAPAARVQYFHVPFFAEVRREEPSSSKSTIRAPGSCDPWTSSGYSQGPGSNY